MENEFNTPNEQTCEQNFGQPCEQTFEQASEQPAAPAFSPKLKIAAILTLAGGFFITRLFPQNQSPLGAFLLSLCFFIATAVFIFSEKDTLSVKSAILPTCAVILSLGYIATSVPVLRTLISLSLCLIYVYWVYCSLCTSCEGFPGRHTVFELIKAVFVVAIPSMGAIWPALFSKRKEGSKNPVGWILLGIAVALVPTAVIIGLLSYDKAFTELLGKLTSWQVFGTLSGNIGAVITGIPVAMFVFALLYASQKKLRSQYLTPYSADRVLSALRFAPAPLAAAAMTPALAVYIIFFISQIDNYVMAFSGLKPDGVMFSEYARNGFFELCAVAAINALILLVATLFTRRTKDRSPLLRVYSSVYSLFTLVLIATALSKMVLYIGQFGLTRLRFLTSCFMVLLAVCFASVLLAQIFTRIRLAGVFAAAAILCLAAVSAVDTDRLIGEYNVNAYLSGKHSEIDVYHFYDLGDGAIPSAVRLWSSDRLHPYEKEALQDFLDSRAEGFAYDEENNTVFEEFFCISIPRIQAKLALTEAGFSFEQTDSDPNTYDSRFD